MFEPIIIEMAGHPQAILDAMNLREKQVRLAARYEPVVRRLPGAMLVVGLVAFFAMLALEEAGVGIFSVLLLTSGGYLLGRFFRLPRHVDTHFAAATMVLHTLRDDTGRKGWVVGTIDLSGARHKAKRTRTARSAGGKSKEYFRDPWLCARLKLADGNKLHITLADKVKVKAGGEVRRHTQAKIKLLVNPALYAPIEHLDLNGGISGPGMTAQVEMGIITGEIYFGLQAQDVSRVLGWLKAVYQQLPPRDTGPHVGRPT